MLKEMKAKGKGIIGMKILGAGRLRSKADESLQFALAQDCVDVFTIGAESRAELKIWFARFRPPACVPDS